MGTAANLQQGHMKLGAGGRFQALEQKLKGKVSNPAAVAASIGRRKYGKNRFQSLASRGRRGSA